jgi:hypothetical protein
VKTIKFLIGLLLLPLVVAATRTLAFAALSLTGTDVMGVSAGLWWMLGGFVLWVALFLLMPRPVRTYVLAHELSHAVWGLLMGARVSKLRVTDKGGSVMVSKTNFLITLAPYFFPFYTVLVLIAYALVSFFVKTDTYEPFWLALVGLSWGFHLTFTITTLMEHQPDIAEHGRLFSYVVIYILNLAGVAFWIAAVASPTVADTLQMLWFATLDAYEGAAGLLQTSVRLLRGASGGG